MQSMLNVTPIGQAFDDEYPPQTNIAVVESPFRNNMVIERSIRKEQEQEIPNQSQYIMNDIPHIKAEVLDVNSPIDKNVDYVAMSYRIATLLRNSDPETYKQCSRFYRNDNSIYIIIIVFLLLICLYMSRYVNKSE